MSVHYKTIMLTHDGSALANQALDHAQMLAAALNAQLILFRVVPEVEPALVALSQVSLAREDEDTKQAIVIKQAQKDLGKLIQQTELYMLKPETVVEMGDDPANAIIEFAAANMVDLIVMSTHGRTGLARLVYGSVAEKVLHHAPCPVLLIRSAID